MLKLTSGQFSAVILDTLSVNSIDTFPFGISYDGTNVPWSGGQAHKLYLQSGLFTSTMKTSLLGGVNPYDISYSGGDTPHITLGKLFLRSGQFTSTVITSEAVSGIDSDAEGISFDGTDTPWCGDAGNRLYLQSGQFSSTLKTSLDINSIESSVSGVSYDGTDTPWSGANGSSLYLQSGQFTSTMKTSIFGDGIPSSIEDSDDEARLGITNALVKPSALSLSFVQETPSLPGIDTTVLVNELTLSGAQTSLAFFIPGSIELSEATLGLELQGITMMVDGDVSVSVLPLSMGLEIAAVPPTIAGDAILLLPGVPMILLEAGLSLHAPEIAVTDDIKIIVTNARTFAISEYSAFAFNSMAKFNGKYLYAKADGIYEGGGGDDNGDVIYASYKTGSFDINATEVQKLRNAYLDFRSSGDIQLFAVGNEINTRLYPFVNSTVGTIHERRQKFERGIKDNHFSFGISNVAGSSFKIKTAKILTEPIRKRR